MSENLGMPVGVSVTLSAAAANALGEGLAAQHGTEHVPYTDSVTFGGANDTSKAADPLEPKAEAAPEDAGAEVAIDANPFKTAQAAHEFAIGAGVEPSLAKFYSGRIEKALQQPAMSPEAQQQSAMETRQAMVDQFGDEAEGYMNVARREVDLLARDHPNIRAILERTNLGNDMHLIKSLIARAGERVMKERGFK
jgi:nitrogenase molybdenum-iron protein alpha/beta subunit